MNGRVGLASLLTVCIAGSSIERAIAQSEPPVPLAAFTPPTAPPPPLDAYAFAAQNFREAEALMADPQACKDCKPLSGVFVLLHDHHFGFYMKSSPGFDDHLIPIFGADEIAARFYAAHSPENMERLAEAGQVPYCECVGWTLDHKGLVYFKIEGARVFNG